MCIDCRREREKHVTRAHALSCEHARHLNREEHPDVHHDDHHRDCLYFRDGLRPAEPSSYRLCDDYVDLVLYRGRDHLWPVDENGD